MIILKNTTGSAIEIEELGIEIPASGQFDVEKTDFLLLHADNGLAEVDPYITSGDIVVNDGTVDLNANEGKRLIRYAFKVYVQQDDSDIVRVVEKINFEGDVVVTDEGGGIATVTIGETGQFKGKLADFIFFSSGNTSNKWINFGNGSTSSDTLPLVMPQDGDLAGITFSNQDDDVDLDIELYVNGTSPSEKIFTWEIRNKRTAFITNLDNIMSVSQGDRISMFARKFEGGTGDQTAQDPIFEVFFNLTSNYKNEGGTQNGI